MEKSIEEIWKSCYTDEDLTPPKYDRHYAKKSKLITEKIKQIQNIDNSSAIPIAIISLVGFAFTKWIYLGFYLFVLFIAFYFFNTKVLKKYDSIDTNLKTYNFLMAYQKLTKELFSLYSKMMTYAFPFISIPIYWLFFKEFDIYNQIIEKTNSTMIILLIVVLVIGLSVTGHVIYYFTVKLIYGNLLTKLDLVIAEMNGQNIENTKTIKNSNSLLFWGIAGVLAMFVVGYIIGTLIAHFE